MKHEYIFTQFKVFDAVILFLTILVFINFKFNLALSQRIYKKQQQTARQQFQYQTTDLIKQPQKMSHLSMNRYKYSQASQNQSRISTETPFAEDQKQNFNIDDNINENITSIRDTIGMLKEYEKLCIGKEDFMMAEQTKNKIQLLQGQQNAIQKQRGILKQQEVIENICKEGEQQVQKFQQYWDESIKSLIEQLKEIQANFVKQQQIELQQYKEKTINQSVPKVKYSVKVLDLRKNLTNLIKNRKYKQAEQTKNLLRNIEAQCQELWEVKNQDRQKLMVQKVQKKQDTQLKALRSKLEAIFNEKIKERDQKFEILLKRNRKRRIESSKTKINKPNQSTYVRSKSQCRVVLGNSKLSSFNCSTKC